MTASPHMLPDMALVPQNNGAARTIAEMAKRFGETSMADNGLDSGEQAKLFAFTRLRDILTGRVSDEAQSLLSPWGTASINLLVDSQGNWNGSSGSLFTPWQDNQRWMTWSQLGISQRQSGLVGNLGVGQRWVAGNWLLGYNAFYDREVDNQLQRSGVGAEVWGESLRLSANYYQPLSGWRAEGGNREQRLARGYDLSAQAWLPFWRHFNTRLTLERYFGDNVTLFDGADGDRNPQAMTLGVNYTPVPLLTFSATHKQGEGGTTQDNLELKLNYRFGVALQKQLSGAEVGRARSLRGSRYDGVERKSLPVMEYRQLKTLSVFLATPPWQLQPGETLELKMQLRSRYRIRNLSWQGDSQALSLTPPASSGQTKGWSIILPAWREGESNEYHLSVTVEDEKGQRATSNWIALKLAEPLLIAPQQEPRYSLIPGE